MIIACERCQTQFQLDEARIPAKGARVRCSRCKHAFFVRPPGASDEDMVNRLAFDAATLRGVGDDTPDPANDLTKVQVDAPAATETPVAPPKRAAPRPDPRPENEATRVMRTTRRPPDPRAPAAPPRPAAEEKEREREREDEESDWEFNDDSGPADDPRSALALGQRDLGGMLGEDEPPSPAPAFDDTGVRDFLDTERTPEDAGGDELGSPEDWDLLGDPAEDWSGGGDAGEPAGFQAADLPAPEAALRDDAEAELESPVDVLGPEPVPWLQRGLAALGWLVVAGLVAVAAHGALSPAGRGPRVGAAVAVVDGFHLESVHGRLLENAGAGLLFVVSGTLRNPDAAPRVLSGTLQVRLLDADGQPLPTDPAWVAPAAGERALREEPPARLLAAQQQAAALLAGTALPPGSDLGFTAVFPTLPDEAQAFRFEVGDPAQTGAPPRASAGGEPGGAVDVAGG